MTNKFQKGFYEGNRDSEFLKEYVNYLEMNPENGDLAEILDCYFMSLPLERRYSTDHLNKLKKYLPGVASRSLCDLIKNWEQVTLTEAQRVEITGMVREDYIKKFADYYFVNKKGIIRPDYSRLAEALEDSTFPFPRESETLIRLWELNRQKDVRGMIEFVIPELVELASLKDMREIGIRDFLLNELLEATDLEQCRVLENALNRLAENSALGSLGGIQNNAVGRSILLEWERNH